MNKGLLTAVVLLGAIQGSLAQKVNTVESGLSLSSWQFKLGPRYWGGSGNYSINLADFSKRLVSRIRYDDLSHNAAELYWRLQHLNGLYLKGYLGGGSLPRGRVIDEDFPPFITEYSQTLSKQRYGFFNYFTIDVGYDLLRQPFENFSLFLGYHYWHERFNGYGCQQLSEGLNCPVTEPLAENGLDEVPTWQGLRFGLNGNKTLFHTFSLAFDVAYLYSDLNAINYHNARPDIRGYVETGQGNGIQLDVLLHWPLTPSFHLGLGGRWWKLVTDGFAHFEQTTASAQPQPANIAHTRYGGLLSAQYKVDETSSSLSEGMISSITAHWPASYIGVNTGYATHQDEISITPTSISAQRLTQDDASPLGFNTQEAGFLAGGQLGYNWYLPSLLLGIEADLDFTQMSGTQSTGSDILGFITIVTNVDKKIDWLSTTRARLGSFIAENTLAYLTGGAAFGKTQFAFHQKQVDVNCDDSTVCAAANQARVQTGWTAGAGIEFLIAQQLTMKTEYLHVDLGSRTLNVFGRNGIGSAMNYHVRANFTNDLLRIGINYQLPL
ncbi:MAG: porin family protein [Legionella sp.]|nr:porin family protein [Legionella sp.]